MTGRSSPTRRGFLRTAGAVAASASLAGPAAARAADTAKPNIIFILADDLGYGDLGCYGQKRIQTPRLDRMAAEGLTFTDAYAGSTVCAPSRCVLMTGLHTGHARIRGNGGVPLAPEDVTVAELLKQAGYATALIGKWGLGREGTTGVPTKQGFDSFFGYLHQGHAHNYYPTFLMRNETRIKLPNVVPNENAHGMGKASVRKVYSHDLFAEEALAWVEKHSARPFFLYLALTILHANNQAGKEGMEVPDYGLYKNKDWPDPQKGHAAMITRMDRDIGRLLDKLKALGLDGKTLVIFTSDNGPHREGGADPTYFHSSGPLTGYKRSLTEGGIRVPQIARWPGRIKAGTKTAHVTGFQDFLPTACELAGAAAPSGVDGISYLPTLLGRPAQQKAHEFLYWEFHEGRGSKQAVRMGKWKAIRDPFDAPIKLFDLTKDIAEKTDLAAKHADVAKQAAACLDAARTANPHWSLRHRAPRRKRPAKPKSAPPKP